MRKIGLSFAVASMLTLGSWGISPVYANQHDSKEVQTTKAQLSEDQKKELAELYEDIFEKRKEVIQKYVEYELMTEEEGKIHLEKLNEHYKKLEENGFVKTWNKKHHKHE